LKEIRH